MGEFPIIKSIIIPLFKGLFPPACSLCGNTLSAAYLGNFCPACLAGVVPLPHAHCRQCSLPFHGTDNSSHLCGQCIKQPPTFLKVYAAGLYEQTLRLAIQQFKFNQKVGLDRSLAQLMAQTIPLDLNIDLIVPVPLHRKSLQLRSYNQASLLAREIGRIKHLPIADDLLLKRQETLSQHQLSALERRKNMQKVFSAAKPIRAKTVLLVDDVMTTGATVTACSKALKTGGAEKVYVAVVCRAAL